MLAKPFRRVAPRLRVFFYCLIFCSCGTAASRVEQFSSAQCAQLAAALELNREQQRRGYQLRHELKIKAQQTQLELQLQYHCQQPAEPQPPPAHRSKRPRAARATPVRAAKTPDAGTRELQISQILVKAPYQGAKLSAWLQFYQPPFYCYGVRQTGRIRQCVEQRQQAQRRFEQQYAAAGPRTSSLSDQ